MKSYRSFSEATAPVSKIDKFLKQKKEREAQARKLYRDREDREEKLKQAKKERMKIEAKVKKDSFDLDDLDLVKYPSLDNKYSKRNTKKRKKGDCEHESVQYDETLDETLNVAQRRRRAIITRRNKAKLARGRAKASRRVADKDRLNNRARRRAKAALVKKLTKGVSKADLSPQRKAEIERRLKKMDGRVVRTQKRILPKVRKDDRGL